MGTWGGNPLNFRDPLGLYGYRYGYDLGPMPLTPEQLNNEVVNNIAMYFPFAGCGPGLYAGKRCSLRFGPLRNPVKGESVTASFLRPAFPARARGRSK